MADDEDEVTRARHRAQEHEAAEPRSRTKTKTRESRDDADDGAFSTMDREALRVREEDDGLSLDERKIKAYEELNPTGVPPGVPGSPGQPEFVPMGVADENGEPVDPPEPEAVEGLTAAATEEEHMEAREAVNEQQQEASEAVKTAEEDAAKEHEENMAPLEKERRQAKGLLPSHDEQRSTKKTAKASR